MRRSLFFLIIGIVSVSFVLLQGEYTYSMLDHISNKPPRKESITASVTNLDFSSETEDKNPSMKPGELILLGAGLVSIAIWGRRLYAKNSSLE